MDAAEGMRWARDPLRRLIVLLAASNGCESIRGRIKLQGIVFVLIGKKAGSAALAGTLPAAAARTAALSRKGPRA